MRRSERYIFLDRDGVINKDPGGWTEHSYVTKWNEFKFIPGALDALKALTDNGYKIIIISNQAGVSKGVLSQRSLDMVTERMLSEVAKNGGKIEEVYYCIHTSAENCSCRKPKSGLLEKAAGKYGIKLHGTYFIGDSHVDAMAGCNVGCRTIFVLSGKVSYDEMRKWEVKPDYIFKDLLEAVNWILAKDRRKGNRAQRRKDEKRSPRAEEEDVI